MVPVLNTELVLEAPERVADGGGGFAVQWTEVGTLWAELASVSETGRVSGGREAAGVTHRIVIRNAPANSPRRPQPECRFRSGGRVFSIRGVAPKDRRAKYLTCWAEEGPFA